MRKVISTLLAIVILTSSIGVQAKGMNNLPNEVDELAETCVEVLTINEGHERVYYGNVIIDDITTSSSEK